MEQAQQQDTITTTNIVLEKEQLSAPEEALKERYVASMLLACVGDVIGYKNGSWEFNHDSQDILDECNDLYGGVQNIDTSENKGWIYSDDTVMHYATAQALVSNYTSFDDLMNTMAVAYIKCWGDMGGRAPGITCGSGVHFLKHHKWNTLPYSSYGGGCGGSMRAMCIGLHFVKNRDLLVACGIESGRLTHNHVNGFMGSLVAAVFTAFALEGIEPYKWGHLFMTDIVPRVKKYIAFANRDVERITEDLEAFVKKFASMLELRQVQNGTNEAVFPANYTITQRDALWKKWSFRGWPGASGDDSVMIAYDALLMCKKNWNMLLENAALHGGDSDSTATIACAWYGALYGFEGVPTNHYANVEGKTFLTGLAEQLFAKRNVPSAAIVEW